MADAAALGVALLVVSACGGAASGSSDLDGLRIMVPTPPGGGYDATARTAAKALADADLLRDVEVFNLPGTGGTVGLQRLVNEKGNGRLAMLMGLGLVGSRYTTGSTKTLQDTTAIARLIEEPDIIVVTPDSPYRTLRDLVTAWTTDPAGVTVGGGSTAGGPDHLATMLVAQAVSLPPRSVRFASYDGGGELLAAVLGGQVAFGVSGVSEYATQIRSGHLRVLAITSERRVPGIDAPTLGEAGVPLTFANWRGIVAPPGLTGAETTALRDLIARLRASAEWKRALDRYGWTDAYLPGDEFARFLVNENARVAAALQEMGLG